MTTLSSLVRSIFSLDRLLFLPPVKIFRHPPRLMLPLPFLLGMSMTVWYLAGEGLCATSDVDVPLFRGYKIGVRGDNVGLLQRSCSSFVKTQKFGRSRDGQALGSQLALAVFTTLVAVIPSQLGMLGLPMVCNVVSWHLFAEDHFAVSDEVLSHHGLNPYSLEGQQHLQLLNSCIATSWGAHTMATFLAVMPVSWPLRDTRYKCSWQILQCPVVGWRQLLYNLPHEDQSLVFRWFGSFHELVIQVIGCRSDWAIRESTS